MGGDSLLRVLEKEGNISTHDETYFDSVLKLNKNVLLSEIDIISVIWSFIIAF